MERRLKRLLIADAKGHRITQPLTEHLLADRDNNALAHGPAMRRLVGKLAEAKVMGVRSGSFHSSQLYSCQRAQVFGYLGVPQNDRGMSPELINIFNDGTWRHIRWQVTLLNAGILTHIEVPTIVPGYRFGGSIDGTNELELWGFELKGTSQFQQVKQYGAMPAHVKQVHGYMLGRPDLEHFIILYEDKATNQWHEIKIPRDPKIIRSIERILNALNEAVDQKDLPEILNECQYGEGAFRSCPYAYACKQVGYAEAEAAAGCSTATEVKVELGIKRNSHRRRASTDGTDSSVRGNASGTTKALRTRKGTLRVQRGIDGA